MLRWCLTWDAHNYDSHSLAEIAPGIQVKPFLGLQKIKFLEFNRRQLHRLEPKAGGFRPRYGSTLSAGMSRGAIVQEKISFEIFSLGGWSEKKGKIFVSIHNIETNIRINQYKNPKELKVLYNTKWTITGARLLPRLNEAGFSAAEKR